jgi:hypothetical protein
VRISSAVLCQTNGRGLWFQVGAAIGRREIAPLFGSVTEGSLSLRRYSRHVASRDLIAEMRETRAQNEARIISFVADNPGAFSGDAAALRLQLSPMTIRSAVKRGVVSLREHRLHPVDNFRSSNG